MTLEELIEALDGLCWQARKIGHDDYGLDYGEDINGKSEWDYDDADDVDPYSFNYHPGCHAVATKILEAFAK